MERRKRSLERFSCFLDAVLEDSVVCKAFDMSEGGVYVRTSRTFAPGKVIKVTMSSGRSDLELKARVKHVEEGFGMGLMFIDLDEKMKSKIRAFLEEVRKIS